MKVFPVFIASPSDCKKERELARKAIDDLTDRLYPIYGIVLRPIRWQAFAPLAEPEEDRGFQHQLNRHVEGSAIFVGILYERYGTEINELHGVSGTEAEFRVAIQNRKRIRILTYFRASSGNRKGVDPAQTVKLERLRKQLHRQRLPHRTYPGPGSFYELFLLDLLQTVLEMITENRRRDYLRRFFRFGTSPRRSEPSVLIGYPAIHQHTDRSSSTQVTHNWRERLLPNVVYEDFKTIQKVETALRYMGVADFSSVTLDSPRLSASRGNRIWLCVPRNALAKRRLHSLGNRVRFRFTDEERTEERCLLWRPRAGEKEIRIRSPLGKYLAYQRPGSQRVWDPTYGKIYVKDYAIISRFADTSSTHLTQEEPFYHYFMAGIRGLGTWGVGWYVDRRPHDLARITECQNNGDVQAVIAVTYENHRILRVEDVSDRTQEELDHEFSDATVQANIESYGLRTQVDEASEELAVEQATP